MKYTTRELEGFSVIGQEVELRCRAYWDMLLLRIQIF